MPAEFISVVGQFAKLPCNFNQRRSGMIVYLSGQYIPREQASIDVDDRGFLFADGVYKVIHSYEGHLFQMDAHLQRWMHFYMGRCARELGYRCFRI